MSYVGTTSDGNIVGPGAPSGAEIELTGLTKHYGSTVATRDVNLRIDPGEFVTFLGPSGSGKTTTLMMIAGFIIPSAGDISVAGTSIVALPPHKRNIGMVCQNYALFPHLDVARNVAFPLEMRRLPKDEIAKRVEGTLRLVRLHDYAHRRPRELSGGQQQRVALARALVFNPPVLLLDEPLGALDAKLREEMKYEIKQLHVKIGMTILFVTHDQQEALTLSDRVAVFDQGTIVQVGTPADLYRRPASRFVASFIGKGNILGGPVIGNDPHSIRVSLGGGFEMSAPRRPELGSPQRSAAFLLRMENVRIGDAANNLANRYFGTVAAAFYSGNATEYVVRLHGDLLVSARIAEAAAGAPVAVGEQISVGWEPADALLIEVDGLEGSTVAVSVVRG